MPDRPPPDPGCICRITWNPNGSKEYRRSGNPRCTAAHSGPAGPTNTAK